MQRRNVTKQSIFRLFHGASVLPELALLLPELALQRCGSDGLSFKLSGDLQNKQKNRKKGGRGRDQPFSGGFGVGFGWSLVILAGLVFAGTVAGKGFWSEVCLFVSPELAYDCEGERGFLVEKMV
ncbi:hypothetical protein KY284_022949 [Solanum tuberosum]|nr:hypothetical protein KY284_022949 [Solanum tuberosum]